MDRQRNTADFVHSDPGHTENVQDASVKQIAGRWILVVNGLTVKLPTTILKADKVTIDKCDNVYFVVSGDFKYVVKVNSRGKIILENCKKINLSTVTDYKATNDDHDDISQKQHSKTTEHEDRKVSQSVAEMEEQRQDKHGDIPIVTPVHGKGEVASGTVNDDASNAICDTNQGETDVKTDCSAGLKLDSKLNINVQHMQTGKFTPSALLNIGDIAETDDSIQLIEKLEIGESALRIPSNEENFKKEERNADYNEHRKDTADAVPALDATVNVQKVGRHSADDFLASHAGDVNNHAGKTTVRQPEVVNKKLEDLVLSLDQARRRVALQDDPHYKGTEIKGQGTCRNKNETLTRSVQLPSGVSSRLQDGKPLIHSQYGLRTSGPPDIHGGARPKQREYNVQRNTGSSTQSKLDKGVEGQAMGRAESPTISSCGYGEELEQDVYDIQSPGQETISQYTDTATASLKSSVTLAVTFQIRGDSEETEIKIIPLPLDKYMQYKYTLQSPTMLEKVNRQLKESENAQLLDRGLIIKTPLENLLRMERITKFVLKIIFEHSETLCFQTFNELENVNDCCIMLMESEFAKFHALYAETIGSEMLAVICLENIESEMEGILSKVLRKKKIEKKQTGHHQPQHSNQESHVDDQQPQTNIRQSQASNQEQETYNQPAQVKELQPQANKQQPSAKIRLTQVGNQHPQPDSRPKLSGHQSQVDCQYTMQMDLIWQRLFQRFQIREKIVADIANINISTCMRSGQWDVTITGSQDNVELAKQMLNSWNQTKMHRKCNLRIKEMDIFFNTKICDIIESELEGLKLVCMVTLSENHDLLIYALNEETAQMAATCVSRMLIEVRIDIPGEWKEKVAALIAEAEGKYPNKVVISEVEHDVLCITGLKDEAYDVADEIREILKETENREPVYVTRTVTFEHHEVFRHLKSSRFIADLSRKYNVDIKSITQCTNHGFEMKGQYDSVAKVKNVLEEYVKLVETETIECRTATGVSYFESKDGQDFVSKMQDDDTVLIEASLEMEESDRSLDDGRMSEAGILMDKKADRVTWRFRTGHKLVLYMKDIGQSESQFVVTSIQSSQIGVGLKTGKSRKGTTHVDVTIPPWIDGKHGEMEATADVFYNVLTLAGEDNENSVAFPLTSEQPEHLTNCLVAGIGKYFLSATENNKPKFAVIQAGDLEIFTKAYGWCQTALSQLTSDECPPSGSRIRVKVEVGSLSETKADILVNTAATSLNLRHGAISSALLQKAGHGLQSECRQKYPWGLQRGEVAVTSGHQLSCKHVFHGALDVYGRDEAQSITELREFINTCFTKASEMKMKTIAFPAIGTGNLGYPADIVASEMFGCMERFQQSGIVTSIQDVIFVVFGGDRNAVKIFKSVEKKFAPSAHVSQSKADTRSRAADRIVFKITGIPKNTTKAKAILEDKIAALKKTLSTYSVELPQSLMSSLKQNGQALVDELKQDLHQYNVELVELPTHTELRSIDMTRIPEAGEHISTFCAQRELIKDFKIPYSYKMDFVIEDVSKLKFELLIFFHKENLRRYERDGINIQHKKTASAIVISGKLERVLVAQMEVQNILKDMMTRLFKEDVALENVQANVDVTKVIENVQSRQNYTYIDGFTEENNIVIYGEWKYEVTKTKQLVLEGLNRGISGRQPAGDVSMADNSSDRKPTASYSTVEVKGKQAADTLNPALSVRQPGSNVSMGDNTRDRQPSQHKGQDARTQQKDGSSHGENQMRTKPFSWKTDARNAKAFMTEEGITIRVYEADILNLPVDCIVNMTNDRLNHFSGIACIIASAAGQQLISEGDEYVKVNGKLNIGEAIPTTAGKLPYRCVIHTVPPKWGSYSPYTTDSFTRCEKDMYNAVQNSLVEANGIMVDSVALPGIGAVSFGVPIEIYAGQYAEAIIAYSRKMASPSLKEIHVIDKDTRTIRTIQDTFDAMISKGKANPRSIASYVTRALPTPRHSGNAQGTSRVSEAGKEEKFVPMCYEKDGKTRQQKQLVCRYGTHHELQIYSGDILHLNNIAAIVCSEDVTGAANGMVAKLLLKNNTVYAQAKAEAFRRKKPRIGDVVATKGGQLSYKWVLHALVPHIHSFKHNEIKWQQHLQALMDTLFEEIATVKYTSVVMSLLGAGMSTDPRHCAEVFYESYSAFCRKHPHLSCQVHLVNKDSPKTDVVKRVFQDHIGRAQATAAQSGSRSEDSRTVAMAGATAMAPKQPGVSPSGSRSRGGRDVAMSGATEMVPMQSGTSQSASRSHDSRHSSQSHDSRHAAMPAATAMLPMQSGTSQSGSRSHDERNVSRSGSVAMVHGKPSRPNDGQTSPTYVSSKQVVKGNQGDGNVKDTKDDSSDNCVICMDRMTNPKQLSCGHSFCTDCIDQHFTYKQACPTCGAVCGIITGDQPDGEMQVQYVRTSVPGYEQFGSIQITYLFPNGRQGPSHPNPGHPYKGISRTAYLPDNEEGQLIFAMLKVAFKRKVIFTIGSSRTTGKEDVITWNDIHHKTDHRPNTQFGYPDPTYLTRVKDELAAKGVTEADLKGSKTEKQRK